MGPNDPIDASDDVAFQRVMEGPRLPAVGAEEYAAMLVHDGPAADPAPETFATKLKQMRRDLATVVDRMNRDGSEDVAMKAQAALNAVSDLLRIRVHWFNDLEWIWQPEEEQK